MGDSELPEVGHAFGAPAPFLGLGQRGQEQRCEDGDDGSNRQQLDQGEASLRRSRRTWALSELYSPVSHVRPSTEISMTGLGFRVKPGPAWLLFRTGGGSRRRESALRSTGDPSGLMDAPPHSNLADRIISDCFLSTEQSKFLTSPLYLNEESIGYWWSGIQGLRAGAEAARSGLPGGGL